MSRACFKIDEINHGGILYKVSFDWPFTFIPVLYCNFPSFRVLLGFLTVSTDFNLSGKLVKKSVGLLQSNPYLEQEVVVRYIDESFLSMGIKPCGFSIENFKLGFFLVILDNFHCFIQQFVAQSSGFCQWLERTVFDIAGWLFEHCV